jgi:hypothetical protein
VNGAEEFHTKLKAALGQLTCAYCGVPIGEITHHDISLGWTHNPQDGPDAYVYCGDDYGTEASPHVDPVMLEKLKGASADEELISKEAFTGLWQDLVQPFDAPAPPQAHQPGACPKCGKGLTRMYVDGGKNIEWVCTYCRYVDSKQANRMDKLIARTDPDGIKSDKQFREFTEAKCPVCMLKKDTPVHEKALVIADEWKKNGKDTAVALANKILSELKLVRWEQLALGDAVRAHVNDGGGKQASCCSECESCSYFSKAASETDTERKQANLRFWNDMKLQHMLEVEPQLRTASAKANYFSLIEHKDGQRIRLGYWPVTSEKTASRLINKLYAEFNRPERYSFYASSDIPVEIEAEPVKEASEITNIEAPIVGTVKNIRPSKHKEGFDILTLEDAEGMTSVVMAPADSYVVGDVIRDDDQPPTQIDGVPVYAASKLVKWKASEPPSGRFRSFSTRAWPSAEYANGDPAVSIYSTDEYRPADAKSGQHAPLTVMIADWGLSPEEKAKRGAFVWRKMKGEFKTLAEAKAAAEKLLTANPQIHSQRPADLTPQTPTYVKPTETPNAVNEPPKTSSIKTADVGTTPESPEGPMNIAVNNGDAQRPGQAKQPEGYAWEWNGKEAILSCPTGSIVLEGQDCREFTTAMMKLDDSDLNDEQLNEKIGEVIAHFFDAKAMAM